MKCVKLAKTSSPTALKDVRNLRIMPAQAAIEKFSKEAEVKADRRRAREDLLKMTVDDICSFRNNVDDRVATLGSDATVYCDRDNGIFSAILAAYNNHWKLRTSPDDWWFCVITRVARAIDENAKKEVVRKMFVEHEGKETLGVAVPTTCIYEVDYNIFFQEMSKKISENVKVPHYVDVVTANFTTTSPTTKIVSQITLMSSLQEFFDFEMRTKCGIPAIEMLGTESDWIRLREKLQALKEILQPISHEIGLRADWWSHAEKVFKKLLKTYQGSPDKQWWDKIIHWEGAGRSGQTCGYTGWLTEFTEGTTKKVSPANFTPGLLTVPLKIKSPCGVEDTAALVAGMIGFTLHEDEVPIVQPFQGWSLLLPEGSPFRSKKAS